MEQTIAKYSNDRSDSDTSMTFGTHTLQIRLFSKTPLATQHSKMAAPKIQDVCAEMCLFLYKSKCIDLKPHTYIKVEYKVGNCGYFVTKYMFISITVLEIEHIGHFTVK